jgi:hypothetical protein
MNIREQCNQHGLIRKHRLINQWLNRQAASSVLDHHNRERSFLIQVKFHAVQSAVTFRRTDTRARGQSPKARIQSPSRLTGGKVS